MADLSDVLTALCQGLAGALYPNGTAQPSAVTAPCVVFPGWPDPASLDADLAAGRVQVSVFPRPGMGRIEGRKLDGWRAECPVEPMMTAVATQTTVTFAGSGMPGQMGAVLEGGRAWIASAAGTPEATAAALAALIAADRSVTVAGATLTLPGAVYLKARVVPLGAERIELRRQQQSVQVTCWCPTPALRDVVASVLDLWMTEAGWMTLSTGEKARLLYAGTTYNDDARQALLHRRDLMVTLDYPTTARREAPTTVVVETFLGPMDPPDAPASAVILS
jgi:hypothetical protein